MTTTITIRTAETGNDKCGTTNDDDKQTREQDNKNNVDSKKTPKEKENVFIIKHTDTTGVYTLETKDGESRGEAHIPNLKMSKILRYALEEEGETKFHCIKNEKFDKWELKELING